MLTQEADTRLIGTEEKPFTIEDFARGIARATTARASGRASLLDVALDSAIQRGGGEMLRVHIELDMFGQGDIKKDLGTLCIWNDSSGTRSVGNYVYTLHDEHGNLMDEGKHTGHIRENGPWPLVRDILEKAQVYSRARQEAKPFVFSDNTPPRPFCGGKDDSKRGGGMALAS